MVLWPCLEYETIILAGSEALLYTVLFLMIGFWVPAADAPEDSAVDPKGTPFHGPSGKIAQKNTMINALQLQKFF